MAYNASLYRVLGRRSFSAWDKIGRGARPDHKYDILDIERNGTRSGKSVTVNEVIRPLGMHMRDIIALGLQDSSHNPNPAILPRNSAIVVALGPFKSILTCDNCTVFGAKRPVVRRATAELASLIEQFRSESQSHQAELNHRHKNNEDEQQTNTLTTEDTEQPFELAVLEAMLQEVCASHGRRVSLLKRAVRDTLDKTHKSIQDTNIEIFRLVPIEMALNNISLQNAELRKCLLDILNNDEDMTAMLLTKKKSLAPGEMLDNQLHVQVELMMESYHRQLSIIHTEITRLQQEVHSAQSLTALGLDIRRNNLIRVNVQLASLNLSVAGCACLYSAFGMNLINGLENEPGVFGAALMVGTLSACTAFIFWNRRIQKILSRNGSGVGSEQAAQIQAMNFVLNDIGAIESVMRSALDLYGVPPGGEECLINIHASDTNIHTCGEAMPMGKDAMKTLLQEEVNRPVTDAEVDLLFSLFDISHDGVLGTQDYRDMGLVKSSKKIQNTTEIEGKNENSGKNLRKNE